MNDVLFLLGRVLFGGYFLYNAYNHFSNSDGLAAYAASKGVRNPKVAVVASGVLLAAGGLSALLWIMPSFGALALTVFLLPVTFTMHAFWKESDPAKKMSEQVQFSKNMALLGGALMMF